MRLEPDRFRVGRGGPFGHQGAHQGGFAVMARLRLHQLGQVQPALVVGGVDCAGYEHGGHADPLLAHAVTDIDLPMLAVLTPLPGTELHRRLADRIVIHDLDYYTLTNAVIDTRLPEETFYRRYAELIKATHADAKL
mgnify:CR=1 FL=1